MSNESREPEKVNTQIDNSTNSTDPSDPLLTDHAYDGIQEFDNPMPGWWKNLFVATVVFSVVYWLYFHNGTEGRTIQDGYERHMASIFELRFAEIGELEPDRETILKYMDDPEWLAVGKVVYKTNCASCHGPEGAGQIGPNLTDDYWKNVKHVEDIADVIANGAAKGAMPAWRNRLSHQNQIVLTAAYIASMRANPLPGNGTPEGTRIPDWTE